MRPTANASARPEHDLRAPMRFEPVPATLAITAAAALRRMRLAAGLTQRQLARALGVQPPVIVRFESGRNVPSLDTCVRYAIACGGTVAGVGAAIDQLFSAAPTDAPALTPAAAHPPSRASSEPQSVGAVEVVPEARP